VSGRVSIPSAAVPPLPPREQRDGLATSAEPGIAQSTAPLPLCLWRGGDSPPAAPKTEQQPGAGHASSVTCSRDSREAGPCQQACQRAGDAANRANAGTLWLRKSLLSPPALTPGKTTHHNFQVRAQESLRVRHLHQNFTFGERDRRGWKSPAAISLCTQQGRPVVCDSGWMIYGYESPTDITMHCSLHPERGW